MLPLGFLFGLGFNTATDVGMLGTAATEAANGVSLSAIMVFPALFAAGMSLIDSTDGILMLHANDLAFVKPIRKLYYNLSITLASVAVAVVIGGIEALGLIGDQLGLRGTLWGGIGMLNDNFTRSASSSSACSWQAGGSRWRLLWTRFRPYRDSPCARQLSARQMRSG
jgi:high-affinity nickel-transport protein